ncbi:MAG: glycerol-3-phosphate dehydrogenase [Stappia sp.]|uniref:glycerol-3-phosphate dehydrogenase n=1 Tax=Stappia sp. TaxID=1870903 RepID=UPI000C56D6AA|nr:glycerol-3-phosphate dehydrogenase [Stappia sp.]MAA97280.1 glycerol-3-phosphate dehydrogenase [Stappia sp.]MBM18563.1 glycerol-3-phosphate dehydrogenase [Stappia sp.]
MTAQDEAPPFDILIIGGGINGCGIARDAAGRGYSVCLAEMNDLASGTSSWSTKLIHGGLRYLEYYEFRLVREALSERELLWSIAPHIIRPLRFVLPHQKGLRPRWMLRLGLFLYDHLGGRKLLPATKTLDLRQNPAGTPLKEGFSTAFEYSDCWVDDARLVALNARDAADRGAMILTRTQVTAAERKDGLWHVGLTDTESGEVRHVRARMLVNAAGPWVDNVLHTAMKRNDVRNVRLVQGSHIVVRKLFDHDRAYIFQNGDGRIVFAIPYEGDHTLIGTTDRDYTGDPAKVRASEDEIAYLISAAGEYFKAPITRDDVVWTYSGVRPLFDDGASKAQEATRDYVLKLDQDTGEDPALVNIFGGKITTYRRLALSVMELVEKAIGTKGAAWTSKPALPGGDFPTTGFDDLVEDLARAHPALDRKLITRMAHAYGTRARTILEGVNAPEDLGETFGAELSAREVAYLMDNEWARTAEDVLWRRSKLGLAVDEAGAARLAHFMTERLAKVA